MLIDFTLIPNEQKLSNISSPEMVWYLPLKSSVTEDGLIAETGLTITSGTSFTLHLKMFMVDTTLDGWYYMVLTTKWNMLYPTLFCD